MRFGILPGTLTCFACLSTPLLASFITDSTLSSSPGNSKSSVAAAVRIFDSIPSSGSIEEGSGTVFSESLSGDVLQLGIVTAAHVISPNPSGVYIGFGNGDYETGIVSPDSLFTAAGGGTGAADVSYIGFSINLSTNANARAMMNQINSITPLPIAAAPTTAGFTFTSYGFGLTASTSSSTPRYEYVYDAANADLSYGVQRVFTNSVAGFHPNFAISDGVNTYVSAVEYYHLAAGQSGDYGASEPGDSGSAMIYNGSIQGVIEYGPGGNSYGYYNETNQEFGGISFTQSYVNWLNAENASFMTPEPGCFSLAATAFVGMAVAVGQARRGGRVEYRSHLDETHASGNSGQ